MDTHAHLLTPDPPDGDPVPSTVPPKAQSIKPSKGASRGYTKPPAPIPPKPKAAIKAKTKSGDIPDALIVPVPLVADLIKVGEVMGYPVHVHRKTVEYAERMRQNLGRNTQWPKDALAATVMALRLGGKMTYREIAEALHMSERHVIKSIKKGSKELVVERELRRLDTEGMPMAVENILEGLEQRDKEYTLEYMKGRGHFSTKRAPAEGEGASTSTAVGFTVRFEHTGAVSGEIRAGAITAAPNLKVLDGQVPPR